MSRMFTTGTTHEAWGVIDIDEVSVIDKAIIGVPGTYTGLVYVITIRPAKYGKKPAGAGAEAVECEEPIAEVMMTPAQFGSLLVNRCCTPSPCTVTKANGHKMRDSPPMPSVEGIDF